MSPQQRNLLPWRRNDPDAQTKIESMASHWEDQTALEEKLAQAGVGEEESAPAEGKRRAEVARDTRLQNGKGRPTLPVPPRIA